jgi:AraC family transcriptional regulator, exoenzyme S synthesis regulatory protein ExsA
MRGDTFIIPDYFTQNNSSEAHIQFYSTHKSTIKNKVVFKQNMICFLIHGTKEIVSLNSSLKLNNKQILLLESGSVLMSETLPENQNYESILFFFSDKLLSEFCIKHKLVFPKPGDTKENYRAIDKDDFLQNFQTSITLLRQKLHPDLLHLKLEELLLYIFHNYKKEFLSFLNPTKFNNAVSIIQDVIATHSEGNLTIDELAFLCNMSISTFKRQFVSLYKTSPKKYFTENKMLKAKQLLNFKKSPSDIYHQLGYESLSSFSNEFKKHFGVSPKQFQKDIEPTAKVFEPLP